MKILLIFLACVTLTYCGKAKKEILDQPAINGYEFEYAAPGEHALGLIESNVHYVEAAPVVAASTGHRSGIIRPGYSVGGPLASIAKGLIRIFSSK